MSRSRPVKLDQNASLQQQLQVVFNVCSGDKKNSSSCYMQAALAEGIAKSVLAKEKVTFNEAETLSQKQPNNAALRNRQEADCNKIIAVQEQLVKLATLQLEHRSGLQNSLLITDSEQLFFGTNLRQGRLAALQKQTMQCNEIKSENARFKKA